MYDAGGQQFGGFSGSPEDLFSRFGFNPHGGMFDGFPGFNPFGGESRRPQKQHTVEKDGSDLKVRIKISLKDAIFGTKKKISVPTKAECPDCHGTGTQSGKIPEPCIHCHGTGMVETRTAMGPFGISITQSACPLCHGSGISPTSVCQKCSGSGRIDGNTNVEIPVPAGAKTDLNSDGGYWFRGFGICGIAGGQPGNLFIKFVEVPDNLFKRSPENPLNLRTICRINPIIALTGGTIEVYTPGGLKKCKIPELTPPGKMFKIKNTWVPNVSGDLEVIVEYDMPTSLTSKTKKALGKIAEAGDFETQSKKLAAKLFNEFNNK